MNMFSEGPPPSWLIVGADGLLGSAIGHELRRSGNEPWETTRRHATVGARRMFWELGQPLVFPAEMSRSPLVAVIAIGAGSIRDHEIESPALRQQRREAMKQLTDVLRRVGARVIYLSTNLVFDGSLVRPNEVVSPCPRTEYGREKRAMEESLLTHDERASACVLRLTKTLGSRWSLLEQWRHDLKEQGTIRPIAGMVCAPLPAEFVAKVVCRVGLRSDIELLHVSPTDDVPYAAIAARWAVRLGFSPDCVVPTAALGDGQTGTVAPAHTTLDSTRLRQELGLVPPNAWETLDSLMTRSLVGQSDSQTD